MSTDVSMKTTPPSTGTTPATNSAPAGISRLFRGDLGQFPVLIALILMAVYFNWVGAGATSGLYLSARNLSNLSLQMTEVGITALAAVLVLLLGEIDLSLAVVSYLCGAVMCVFSVEHGWGAFASILAGLAVGAVIGLVNGIVVAVIRVPSFIVTLAGLLGYQGVLQHILFPNTSLRLTDTTILNVAGSDMPDWLGYSLPIIGLAGYAAWKIFDRISRQRKQLPSPSWAFTVLNIVLAAVPVVVALYIFESYFGVPYLPMILIGLIGLFWVLLRFTTFGRHVYAVGGNAEAARRAGINVTAIRIAIFTLASSLAAVAGMLEASRQTTATTLVSNVLLLQAIAAAVIGGVSLFGGRGSVWGVVVGTLVIYGLVNGLNLRDQQPDVQLMVQGVVLLLAVIIDALLRRRNAVTGR
jgi:D-xylose transport system permease protein